MKTTFYPFYDLPETTITSIWENAFIVFDTNVLLDLFRCGKNTRTEFIDIMKKKSDQLWIPYQIGYEFHFSVSNSKKNVDKIFNKLITDINESVKKIGETKNEVEKYTEVRINERLSKVLKMSTAICDSIKKQKESIKTSIDDKKILSELSNLYEKKVGSCFTNEEFIKSCAQARERYSYAFPPGYKDANKPGNKKFGDYILWTQIIQHSKKERRAIIFVTNDHKKDWWEDGITEKARPRQELLMEFYQETEMNILFYDSKSFLEQANHYISNVEVSKELFKDIDKAAKIREDIRLEYIVKPRKRSNPFFRSKYRYYIADRNELQPDLGLDEMDLMQQQLEQQNLYNELQPDLGLDEMDLMQQQLEQQNLYNELQPDLGLDEMDLMQQQLEQQNLYNELQPDLGLDEMDLMQQQLEQQNLYNELQPDLGLDEMDLMQQQLEQQSLYNELQPDLGLDEMDLMQQQLEQQNISEEKPS